MLLDLRVKRLWLFSFFFIKNIYSDWLEWMYKRMNVHWMKVISILITIKIIIMIAEHRGIVSPSIVEHTSHVSVSQDEGAVLLCIAQGCPTPEYR